jgi:hypothetical protein
MPDREAMRKARAAFHAVKRAAKLYGRGSQEYADAIKAHAEAVAAVLRSSQHGTLSETNL